MYRSIYIYIKIDIYMCIYREMDLYIYIYKIYVIILIYI